ncbi:DUF5105 domain-containing protein [Aminipila butyrica]|uniref:DUF5105 domain-containing protein n=1 Tax=Aminipila butyrica TaxID=433296 RepID=A0A858BT78_9FIRM|nr:DUF5105 domain-containing protein [Aminipila butyrica]QIB68562.1 DUF5105 domain-containing protein [Aminipila butyrica]
MKKIFSVFLVSIIAISLVGCGGESPEQAVKNALGAIKNMDTKTASKYLDYEELMNRSEAGEAAMDADSEAMAKLMLENLEYKIVSSEVDEDSAIVKTEITNTDMSKIMADFFPQLFGLAFSGLSEDQLGDKTMEIFTNLMNRTDNKTVTNTVDIKLSKDENSWKIDANDELTDAIFGGLLSVSEDIGSGGEDKLSEINNWLIEDIWNNGLCEISYYTYDGTSSTGDTIDMDFTLSQFDVAMGKKAAYDKYINSLEGEQYAQIKSIWEKLSPEIDNLYNQIKANKPVASDLSTDVDTGKFEQYHDAFSDAIDEIE